MKTVETRSAETRGGHGGAGMESEEGTAFESLLRRKLCRNTPFFTHVDGSGCKRLGTFSITIRRAGSESTQNQDFELAAKLSPTPEATVQTQKARHWMIFRNLDRKAIRIESLRRG